MNARIALCAALAILSTLSACLTLDELDVGRTRIAKVALTIQPELVRACSVAMGLAPFAGPVAPWIIGGCGAAEAIDRLALNPSSTAWVNGLIAGVSR